MYTNNVICLGDGFATGHIWPEWPQIIKALMPDYNITIISGVGAGTEFLVSEMLTLKDIQGAHVIFQWPTHNRLDKLLEDDTWDTLIKQDQVYRENFVDTKTGRWWLSSASNIEPVRQYHKFFIQEKQLKLRQEVYKQLVTSFLRDNHCNFIFTGTQEQDEFSRQKRFASLRQAEVQPSPFVHYKFATEILLPELGVSPNNELSSKLENIILSTKWIPYHPDRDYIWSTILNQLTV